MIEKNELSQILAFVAKRWTDLSRDPENKAVKTLPDTFWMNSIGGPAGKGRWITTNNFKEVLLRWQTKSQRAKSSDLIQINDAKK